eukprot:scaffold53366_cov41-Attheya_sp.AAC.2
MSIVNTPDTRNADFAKSNFGAKLMQKMGWTEGNGLGRKQQGMSTHLRAVRRSDETLGIGASTDTYGEAGWKDSSHNFGSVLASLKEHHSSSSSSSLKEGSKKKKSKKSSKGGLTLATNKKARKRARKEKRRREEEAPVVSEESDMTKVDKKSKKRKKDPKESR